jgi:hypothetical protein
MSDEFWRKSCKSTYHRDTLCSLHDFPYIRGWMQMVTSTKWFIFLKQRYSKAQSLLRIHYIIAVQCIITLTLCITVSWSRGETVSLVCGHAAMSLLLHCPEPTAAPPPSLGGLALLSPRWHPLSQDPCTLPLYRLLHCRRCFNINPFQIVMIYYKVEEASEKFKSQHRLLSGPRQV